MVTAREMMSTRIVELDRSASAKEAADLMASHRVGSVIVTADDYPIGILTETDIVRLVAAGTPIQSVRADDVMSSPLFSTKPDEDLLSVAATMSQSRIKKMPVLEGQRLIGIITQTDIVHFALRAIEDMHAEYAKGRLTASEFSARASELFSTVPKDPHAVKEWHMRCTSCGNQFLAEERDGKLLARACPRCGGSITYDLSPPV